MKSHGGQESFNDMLLYGSSRSRRKMLAVGKVQVALQTNAFALLLRHNDVIGLVAWLSAGQNASQYITNYRLPIVKCMESLKIDAYVVKRINLESVLYYFSMKSQFLFWIREQTKKSSHIRTEVTTYRVRIEAWINVPLRTSTMTYVINLFGPVPRLQELTKLGPASLIL